MKDKSEVNNFIGRKTKEDLNYPLTFVLLGILTKNYSKYNCYTNFTHRDIADKVNDLFKNLIDIRGWNTNEKELDLKVRKNEMKDLKWIIIFGLTFIIVTVSVIMFALHQWATMGVI